MTNRIYVNVIFLKQVVIMLIIIVLFSLLCQGCAYQASAVPTVNFEANAKERNIQTLWNKLDSDGNLETYLEEDQQDVLGVKKIIEGHINTVDNRNNDSLNLEEEMKFYKLEFAQALVINGYDEEVKKMYEQNNLKLQSKSIVWYAADFNSELSTCKARIESLFTFISANDDYLKSLNVSLGQIYLERRIYFLEKEDGQWRISNITKGALETSNNMQQ